MLLFLLSYSTKGRRCSLVVLSPFQTFIFEIIIYIHTDNMNAKNKKYFAMTLRGVSVIDSE